MMHQRKDWIRAGWLANPQPVSFVATQACQPRRALLRASKISLINASFMPSLKTEAAMACKTVTSVAGVGNVIPCILQNFFMNGTVMLGRPCRTLNLTRPAPLPCINCRCTVRLRLSAGSTFCTQWCTMRKSNKPPNQTSSAESSWTISHLGVQQFVKPS